MTEERPKTESEIYGQTLDEQIKALQMQKKQAKAWAPVDAESTVKMVADMEAIKAERIKLAEMETALDAKATVLKTRYPVEFLKMVIESDDVKGFMFGAKTKAKATGKAGTTASTTGTNWYDRIVSHIPVMGIDKDALHKLVMETEADAKADFVKRAIGNDTHTEGQTLSIPSIISKGMAKFDGGLVKLLNVTVPEEDKPEDKPEQENNAEDQK